MQTKGLLPAMLTDAIRSRSLAGCAGLLLPAALVWLALAGSAPAASGPPASADPVCVWTDRPLKIDGAGDEPAWKAAPVIDRFLIAGGKGAQPRAGTRARLLWDRSNLYFLTDMDDRDLFADVTEHDGSLWRNDVFELFFKPAEDHAGYFEFEVNAAGAVLDTFIPRREGSGPKTAGDFHLETKVRRRGTLNQREDRDHGWTVEGRIPWTDLLRAGGRPEIGEQWRMTLCRYDYTRGAEPELSSTAPLSRADFHRYEEYASVRFAGPSGESARTFGIARRVPLTTSHVAGSPDPPDPYRVKRLYPKLKLSNPEIVYRQPGSDRLIAITQVYGGGPSKLIRFRDDPAVDIFETLLSLDTCAYDLTFHPDFVHNGYLYLGAKGPLSAPSEERKAGVTRYKLAPGPDGKLDPASAKVIIDWPSDGHDGAALAFGRDGMLYVTSGDGTTDSDTHIVGQDLTRLTAKLLRIDVDHPDRGRAYSVPKDNPFVGREGVRPETWAYGFRNPWRLTSDAETGQIWVGMNGQDLWESAYLVERGANYGWSVFEGSHPFYPSRTLGPTPVSKPTVEHPHSEARSLTGGLVYRGQRFPELRGAYIYGDYSTGKIWGVKHDGQKIVWHKELTDTSLQITGFGTDAHGELLVTDMRGDGQGGFYALEPTPKDLPPSTFPRKLSESGLFRSVKGHVPQPALIPYSVNAPLWSDGAYKERFIALPGSDSRIDVTPTRGWSFPDGAVLVKSFALEREEGNPRSRRWVETRFLTKQDGEWVGYSYLWNDQQTDATLVEAKGEDREFAVRVPRSAEHPEGIRKQSWHYPSRAECMTCHSRAANFVLGLSTLQMNRVHDYGGIRDNQLRVLEHLGVLRVDYGDAAREQLRAEARTQGLNDEKADTYVGQRMPRDDQRQPPSSTMLAVEPEKLGHLTDPADRKADLADRARSYLHANCAQCHVEAGGGNSAMELEFTTPLAGMRVLDVKPLHDAFKVPDPRLVAPGSPERSLLLQRLTHRDRGHMPPLATSVVDRQAVELLTAWIRALPAKGRGSN